MTDPKFQIKLWGTRGGVSVSGPDFHQFGGNTTCFEVRCGEARLLFDAGSGLPPAGQSMQAEGLKDYALFFSHFHYDHVIGLPFFVPLYYGETSLRVWSGHMGGQMTTCQMFQEFMRAPFFPVGLEVCGAHITDHGFSPGDVITPHPGVTMRTGMLNHPGGAIGYRVEFGGKALAIITDTEHDPGTLDPAVLALIDGVDLFLYDATFEDSEMKKFRGYGHSTWQHAIRLAQAAGAKRVGFVHHAIFRTDADLLSIEAKAQAEFPGAFCGRDLQVIDI
ncbi:MAG: MBL fold metallo-hydrolase [Gemmobacter sp.]|nr:MBL fold metallo-hydrolase [Gemmobacter sp.]